MKRTCMRCKYFKIEDPVSGLCRVPEREPGSSSAARRIVRGDDSCEKWVDCGQQYYIRLGWIKAYSARESGINTQ